MYDVIVVGAGPVGSQTAFRLAGLGHGVAVIERKTDIGAPVCCTGIVGEECVSTYNISETVIYRHASSAQVISSSGRSVRLHRESPQVSILDRSAFNALMADRAQSQGATYMLGTRATSLKLQPRHIEVTCSRDGRNEHIEARAAVIASGFNQELVGKTGLRSASNVVGGAQAEVATTALDETEVYLGSRFSPGYFAWLVPIAPRRALAGLLARRAPREKLKSLLSFLRERGKVSSQDVTISNSAIVLKHLDRTYTDRLLVVGTAAGQVKPTTGGGIYYGLLCADLAAQTLDGALRSGRLCGKDLSGYERAWKATLGDELRTGQWARKLYERLSDRRIDRILATLSSGGLIEELLSRDDVSFDWHGRSLRHLLTYRTLAKLIGGL